MKLLFSVIAGCISLSVAAQKNISVNQHIHDDGKELSIKIQGTINGKPVDYDSTFNVTGMDSEQKDAIKHNVYDSLGLPDPVTPRAPLSPQAVMAPVSPLSPVEAAPSVHITSGSSYTEIYTVGGAHPYTKEIKYNPKTGILHMKYHFSKNGEEVIKEKSVEAKDKSKEERDQIIKKYERELGVLQTEAV